MQENEQANEPSMEDILASIRKIIAEEPADAKPGTVAQPVIAMPAPALVSPPVSEISVAAKPSMSNRLSDVVRALAPSAVPVAAAAGNGGVALPVDDDFAELVEPAETVAAAQATASVAKVSSAPAADRTPASGPAVALPPAIRDFVAKASDAKPLDLGSFVPGTAESSAAVSVRPLPASIAADFHAADSAKTAAARLQRSESGLSAPASTLRADAPVTAVRPSATPAASDDATDAARSALGALAAGLATPSLKSVGDKASPANESGPAAPKSSLDELIVGMIRPMVRDWLDANLPKLVEQAVADEIKRRGH